MDNKAKIAEYEAAWKFIGGDSIDWEPTYSSSNTPIAVVRIYWHAKGETISCLVSLTESDGMRDRTVANRYWEIVNKIFGEAASEVKDDEDELIKNPWTRTVVGFMANSMFYMFIIALTTKSLPGAIGFSLFVAMLYEVMRISKDKLKDYK